MWTCPDCGRQFKRKNQNHFCKGAPATIEEYIERRGDNAPALKELLRAMKAGAPTRQETMPWGMPTLKGKGNIISFALYKDNITVYTGRDMLEKFKGELAGYKTEKGAFRIPLGRDIPTRLITQITARLRAEDIGAR